jgi:hypothetical protein
LIAEWYDRQRARVGLRISNGEDVVDLTGADECVDFRYLGFQLIAVTFDQTARDDQSLCLSVCLELSGFENRVDRFLLCRIDEATRVDDDRLRVGCIRRDLITTLLELAHHHLAVDEVFGTTQTDKSDFLTSVHL